MRINEIFLLIFFSLSFHALLGNATKPIEPKDVLSDEEMSEIVSTNNFFLNKNFDHTGPIWDHLERKYGSHYLKARDDFYSLENVVDRTIEYGFPVAYKIQELYRSGLAEHVSLGKLLPRLSLAVGQGTVPIDVNNFAANLFGFLLPHNWFSLIQARKANKATQLLLYKTVLDQAYTAELLFLELHQLIQEFEIRNFYLIHLQLLSERLGLSPKDISLAGSYAQLGTDTATNRGDIKLKFDDLAKMMALRTDRQGRYATEHINIHNVKDFPDRVKELEEMGKFYNNQEDFISEVLKKSIELRSIEELYEVSKFGVGVTAFGSIFSVADSPTDNYVRLGVNLGYDTLPNILTSVSASKTANINVQEQFVAMVDLARRAFDQSTNAMGGFTEATRSTKINRKAFFVHLHEVLDGKKEAGALFLRDFSNLLDAELKLNNALHGTLKAHALMRRLLLTDEKKLEAHLPEGLQLHQMQRLFLSQFTGFSRHGSHMDDYIHHLRKPKELQAFLNGNYRNFDRKIDKHDKDSVKRIVADHLPELIHRWPLFHNKHQPFYSILYKYVTDNKLHLSHTQERKLKKRAGLHVHDLDLTPGHSRLLFWR